MLSPTEEQLLALEMFQTRRPLKITAFAGAGKTTTLPLLAESRRSPGVTESGVFEESRPAKEWILETWGELENRCRREPCVGKLAKFVSKLRGMRNWIVGLTAY